MHHLAERQNDLRIQLEADLSPEATARVRGQLAEVKRLLALDTPLSDLTGTHQLN